MTGERDRLAIEKVVLAYYHAMVSGDGPALCDIFDGDAHFHGLRDGVEVRRDLAAFVAIVETPAPESDREVHIASIDRTGGVAVAKLIDRFRGRLYTDYLLLVDAGAGWKIVAKAFWTHAQETIDD